MPSNKPSSLQPVLPDTDPVEPILVHEKSLTEKVAKQSEAGDVVEQQILWLGTQLVTQLHVLIKTSRLHDPQNTMLDQPVNNILTIVKTLAKNEPVTIRVQSDFLFLGKHHLKSTVQLVAVFTGFIDSCNAWHIGALSLAPTVSSHDLREFGQLFVTLDHNNLSLADLRQQMVDRGVAGITLEENKVQDGRVDQRSRTLNLAKGGYGAAAAAVGDLQRNIKGGGTISFKVAKRAIQNIVDLMSYDESALLGLTNLRCHDEYTHNHSVNVCVLAVALANRVGYPRVELADLGLAALFHDTGKISIPTEVLNKPGEFNEEEWRAMREHPSDGVLELTKARGITNLPGRMAAASFEHHMNCDSTGYPKLTMPWTHSLTGRILMLVDCYDAMTASRVYRRDPIPPERVLKLMLAKGGQAFDPVLLKLFVTCVGILPIGSLVLLDTKELAVVTRAANHKKDPERPWVKVITDPEGQPIEGPEVDLTEMDGAGQPKRSILRLVDNTKYHFDIGRYFV